MWDPSNALGIALDAAGGDTDADAENLSRVMMSPNEAAPRTRSAMPGADGSFENTSMLGELNARSTSTTRGAARQRARQRDGGARGADVACAADHGNAPAALAGAPQRRGDFDRSGASAAAAARAATAERRGRGGCMVASARVRASGERGGASRDRP